MRNADYRPAFARRLLAILPYACALLAPVSAVAQDDVAHLSSSDYIAGLRFDAHANVGGYGLLGAGFRVDIPLISNGLLAGVNDELALSPGLDAFFAPVYHYNYDGGPYWLPSCVMQWNFYLGNHWSVFPEAGLALYMGNGDYLPRGRPVYAAVDIGVGARYHFSHRSALLARVSSPTGLQLGVTF